MKRFVLLTFFSACAAYAAPKKKVAVPPAPIEPPQAVRVAPESKSDPKSPRSVEFQGDDVSLALRTLARQAKMNLVVTSHVKGTVTMKLDDKSPREAIDIICQVKGLTLKEHGGVYFVDDPSAAKAEDEQIASGKSAPESASFEESITKALTPGIIAAGTKFYDALLDIAARPESAQKIAKAKKALFDALIAEGFTREEALKIVIYSGKVELPDLLK